MDPAFMDLTTAPGREHEQEVFNVLTEKLGPVASDRVPATAKREPGVQGEEEYEDQGTPSKQPTERLVQAVTGGDHIGEGANNTVRSDGSKSECWYFDAPAFLPSSTSCGRIRGA